MNDLNTGDMLLFSPSKKGRFGFLKALDWLIETTTHSPYTHVAFVLKDPTFIHPHLKGLYIWESGYEGTRDPQDGKIKLGVQITSLHQCICNFEGDIYIRKMTMFKGTIVVGAIHKHLHMCFLLEGHLSVASAAGVREYVAPCYIIAEPGEKRILYSHEDSRWYNTHKNPNNTRDIKELENQIVAINYEDYNRYKQNTD